MALDNVANASCGANFPLRKYSGTTSFAFVDATNLVTGNPMRFANSPAVKLPKFPLGTETISGTEATGNCRYAAT
jgi:hypothetical protein